MLFRSGANGLINLSIPIKGGRSVKTAYSNVEIDYKVDWQKSHLRSIASIYGNAPYFEYYKSDLEHLYKCREVNLFKWNLKCFDFFMSRSKLSKMMDFGVLYDNFKEGDLIRELGDDFSGSLPLPMYPQVFSDKIGFQSNVSSLDLLMNLGPESASYIQEASNKLH